MLELNDDNLLQAIKNTCCYPSNECFRAVTKISLIQADSFKIMMKLH